MCFLPESLPVSKTAEEACVIAARILARHSKDVPFALLYLLDGNRKQAHLASAAGIEKGEVESPLEVDLNGEASCEAIWPLAETARSATMQIVEDLQGKLASVPPGPWSDSPHSAVVWPIRSSLAHHLAGLMVLGISSRLQFDDSYRDFSELVTRQVATAIANPAPTRKSANEPRHLRKSIAPRQRSSAMSATSSSPL